VRAPRRRLLGAAAAAALGPAPGAAAAAATAPFAFALVGDNPYTEADAGRFARVLAHTGEDTLRFVLHVGDIKAGGEPCTDTLLARRGDLLAGSLHPLVLLPGDNDWTDCHRPGAGSFDPPERLAALRARFFADDRPLGGGAGPDLGLRRQPHAPENVRWRVADVHFVGLHVVGSDNGRDPRAGPRAGFEARRRRNETWLHEAVDDAVRQAAGGLVIAFHANPLFHRPSAGFVAWVDALREAAAAFGGPILLLHGDTHRFRVDRPLTDARGRVLEHVTRVECFGHPFSSSWVRILCDPSLPERFAVAVRDLGHPVP
jgi:hypothetical protein